MERKDKISGPFCFLISLIVIQQSLNMTIGTVHTPGPGMLPLILGVTLAILSSTIFIKAFIQVRRNPNKIHLTISWTSFRRLGIIIVILLGFTYISQYLGFFFSLFWILFFLFRDPQHQKRWIPLLKAALTIAAGYLLFHIFLQIQFPRGPWGIR